MDIYVFGGLGFMFFNPKGRDITGKWVALQPLGTEGQGLPGEEKKYNRTTFTIPYGIGIGKSIDRYWQVNIEFTMRQTFTDYIDDVSDTYYGRQNLYDAKVAAGVDPNTAAQIAYLSDPRLGQSYYGPAEYQGAEKRNDLTNGENIRGDVTDNDSYMTGMITIARKIVKRRRSRPKF